MIIIIYRVNAYACRKIMIFYDDGEANAIHLLLYNSKPETAQSSKTFYEIYVHPKLSITFTFSMLARIFYLRSKSFGNRKLINKLFM